MLGWVIFSGCVGVADSAATPEGETGGRESPAESSPVPPGSEEQGDADAPPEGEDATDGVSTGPGAFEGAIVTRDCMYETYPYAIDILLSCGSERFDAALRLHTLKRHSHDHRKVFADQRIAHRDQQLWFDGYGVARCVRFAEEGRLMLETDAAQCSTVALQPLIDGFRLSDPATGRCAGLGDAQCEDHAFTGGRECGGTDHRYLPLLMGNCDAALTFGVQTEAQNCSDEYPDPTCF